MSNPSPAKARAWAQKGTGRHPLLNERGDGLFWGMNAMGEPRIHVQYGATCQRPIYYEHTRTIGWDNPFVLPKWIKEAAEAAIRQHQE